MPFSVSLLNRGPRQARLGTCLGVLLALGVFAPANWAQSSPSDLTDLSLAELMDLSVVEDDSVASTAIGKDWRISYRYLRRKFDGYRNGTDRLSDEEVLFSPGETRTDSNFPVLPTVIIQEAHVAEFSYQPGENWGFSLLVPYIEQSTDHISIVPGYPAFNITTRGLGDLALAGSRSLWTSGQGSLSLSSGISLPTGSIDEKGDTPRAPGNQQLPNTMQLGSGTFDLSAGFTYSGNAGARAVEAPLHWGFLTLAKVRLGRNSRDYRLGNSLFASTWLGTRSIGLVRPSLRLDAQAWGRISGEDESLSVPGPFPYPAAVTNPRLFGGEKVSLVLGIELRSLQRQEPFSHHSLRVDFGGPVYQNLNGPQPEEDWSLSVSWTWEI